MKEKREREKIYPFSELLPVKVCAPDAHVDPIEEVVGAADLEPAVEVLQIGVVHDLVRVGDVLLDRAQLGMRAHLGLRVHPGYLELATQNRNFYSVESWSQSSVTNLFVALRKFL